MKIGFDMLVFHLDQIKDQERDAFKLWNGGKQIDGKVQGGDAAFAGRNFLGGQWIWGPSEATDSKTNRHPEDITKLNTTVPLIAPIQGPQKDRQNVTGTRGYLYGKIDGQAICERIHAGVGHGEFRIDNQFVLVWLAVDPAEPLSVDYWGGWSEQVNNYSMRFGSFLQPQLTRPFLSGILCQYTESGGTLTRAPSITTAVIEAHKKFPGAICYSFWADAPDSAPVAPNPKLDWQRFVRTELPNIWRFASDLQNTDGSSVNVPFQADAVKEPTDLPAGGKTATDYMLTTLPWQPSVSGIFNIGFSSTDKILDKGLDCTLKTPIPDMTDSSGNYKKKDDIVRGVPGAFTTVIGRYAVRSAHHGDSLSFLEAQRLSNARMQIFTAWELGNPNRIEYFRPPANAALDAQGNLDARKAFAACAEFHQPPQTPVFFAVDFDGGARDVPNKDYITDYFRRVRTERDAFAKQNPDHYYLVGVYAGGQVMQWLYEWGDVDYFWQTMSEEFKGSEFATGNWPWYHSNRWQYQGTEDAAHPLPVDWHCVPGFDPDADWGDGGTWNLNDALAKDLRDLQSQEFVDQFVDFFRGLLHPK